MKTNIFMMVAASLILGSGCSAGSPSSMQAAVASKGGRIVKSDAEWRNILTPEQYSVLRQKGTERPGSGEFDQHFEKGTYTCAGCGQPLFSSDDKFDAGCGWPSFSSPASDGNIDEHEDRAFGMVRTEVLCKRCGGHLGHVFPDGPAPTGLRYCINSASLGFVPGDAGNTAVAKDEAAAAGKQIATFGGGCFWCTEAVFARLPGVLDVTSGYMGGEKPDPTYRDVSAGDTGYAEVVQVTFDPSVISYEALLAHFWSMHDPTTPNRQGADRGTQYRSVIFWHDDAQRKAAEKSLADLSAAGKYDAPVVTEITKASRFYPAEDYHQDYFERNSNQPYCRAVISPKLKKLGL